MRRIRIVIAAICLGLLLPQAIRAQTPPPELTGPAEKGDPNFQWALGHYYLTNTSDSKQAYYWLKKAADAGQANAKIELAANFASGSPSSASASSLPAGATPFTDAQTTGIIKRADQAKALVKAGAPDTRLTMFRADSEQPPQYIFYSPMKQQQVTIVDIKGTLTPTPPSPGSISLALPGKFIDLPQAIAAAKAQGMHGDIKSALLMTSQAKGKAPVAVWILTPVNNDTRFLSYFVAAEDGQPVPLTDFSDGINGSDAQLKAIQDAQQQQQSGNSGGGGTSGSTVRSNGYNANAAYAESQRRAYNYEVFQGDSARAANCREHGC